MLKEKALFWAQVTRVVDLAVVTLTFFAAWFWRRSFGPGFSFNLPYVWIIPVFWLLWGSLLQWSGIYESQRLKKIHEILWQILKAGIAGFLIFASINYLFKMFILGRLFTVFYFFLTTVVLSVERVFMHQTLKWIRRQGKNYRNALVVGITEKTRAFLERSHEHPEIGLKVVGLIDHQSPTRHRTFLGLPVLGGFKDIPKLMQNMPLDYIFFLVPRHSLNDIEPLIQLCETHGITTSVSANLFKLDLAHTHPETVFGFPMITFKTTPIDVGQLFLKRSLDIFLSALALAVLSPVFLALALAVRFTSPGPVFFRQRRCTLNGRDFILYKFRTMSADAEQRLETLKAFNEMQGPAFKMDNDPRVTPLGRWLRRLSLDELPQLWNVLRGDMSLVGPRPPLPEEVAKYQDWQRRKLSMRAGLTCLWQVNGRSRIRDFNEWTKLDLAYIDNWSIRLDFQIMLKTFWAVFSQAGAK